MQSPGRTGEHGYDFDGQIAGAVGFGGVHFALTTTVLSHGAKGTAGFTVASDGRGVGNWCFG